MAQTEAIKSAIDKISNFYQHKKDAPIYRCEFGFRPLKPEAWGGEPDPGSGNDWISENYYDENVQFMLGRLGWCEGEFSPWYEPKVLEDRGKYELFRDRSGRQMHRFKGDYNWFMPSFEAHPVADEASWERDVKWRLDPETPERYADLETRMAHAKKCQDHGIFICQEMVGGYMFLRSLIGPEQLLYMFYDNPKLISICMEAWFNLADKVCSVHQQYVDIDEIYMAEDICFNHGPLISYDMIREFLLPYYQQFTENLRKRQSNGRKIHIHVDTDGFCVPVIDIYREMGMACMSPIEAASGCDVVEIRQKYPDLLLKGGFDKRIMAGGKDGVDRELERIMPFMRKHGGYIPTCDHIVPIEVTKEKYLYYRRRMSEYCV